jgi:hypothetical protein
MNKSGGTGDFYRTPAYRQPNTASDVCGITATDCEPNRRTACELNGFFETMYRNPGESTTSFLRVGFPRAAKRRCGNHSRKKLSEKSRSLTPFGSGAFVSDHRERTKARQSFALTANRAHCARADASHELVGEHREARPLGTSRTGRTGSEPTREHREARPLGTSRTGRTGSEPTREHRVASASQP